MLLGTCDGYAIECTHPGYVEGLHRVWVTDAGGAVRARGRGETVAEALIVALETWGERGDLADAEASALGQIWDRLEFGVSAPDPAGVEPEVDAESQVGNDGSEVPF